MSDRYSLLRLCSAICLVLILGVSMNADATDTSTWREEVLLHDGSKIIVERTVERGGRHEIGQKSPYKEQRLSFTLPGTKQTITWEDHYSEDIGTANFLPMALDIVDGIPHLVVHPMGCLSYNKWGRPNPPYVIFQYQGNEWTRIASPELPAAITTPNLIVSMPDIVVEKLGTRFVSAAKIREVIDGYTQPEFKAILREAYPSGAGGCSEMIRTNDGWEGLGFLKHQPSYEACVKYCARKGVNQQNCPCDTFFKGN